MYGILIVSKCQITYDDYFDVQASYIDFMAKAHFYYFESLHLTYLKLIISRSYGSSLVSKRSLSLP